eukprot:scaffold53824_cov47-Prasinocladus_malaysianus.AAC.2
MAVVLTCQIEEQLSTTQSTIAARWCGENLPYRIGLQQNSRAVSLTVLLQIYRLMPSCKLSTTSDQSSCLAVRPVDIIPAGFCKWAGRKFWRKALSWSTKVRQERPQIASAFKSGCEFLERDLNTTGRLADACPLDCRSILDSSEGRLVSAHTPPVLAVDAQSHNYSKFSQSCTIKLICCICASKAAARPNMPIAWPCRCLWASPGKSRHTTRPSCSPASLLPSGLLLGYPVPCR